MKINIRTAFVLSAFAILLTFASISFGQPIVGGYKAVANNDKDAKAAADYAVDTQATKAKKDLDLLDVVKAERQIVAGTNYRLCLKIDEDRNDMSYVQAVVYRNLQNKYELTSWKVSTCGGTSAAAKTDGFKPLEKDHAGAGLAADFAVKEKSKTMKPGYMLEEVVKAEMKEGTGSKIGSGDFRDCLKVSLNRNSSFVQAVVSMDQYNNFKLISWENSKCGGDRYSPVEKTHPGAGLAADFAVKEESNVMKTPVELVSIVKAETESGPRMGSTNFRLCLIASGKGVGPGYQAIVSMDQYSNLKLVSWTASKCVETDGDYEPVEKGFTAGVDMAADWAVAQHSKDTGIPHKLIEILKGEEKGMFSLTYRICMTVGEEGKTQTIQAIVTRDQYSNHKLISWEHSTCGK